MLTKFQTLKPWFVKSFERMELNELRCGLNILRARTHVHDSHCVYSCEGICKPKMNSVVGELFYFAHTQTYSTLTSLWS